MLILLLNPQIGLGKVEAAYGVDMGLGVGVDIGAWPSGLGKGIWSWEG